IMEIGNGTEVVGTFTNIDWGNNSKFMEIELDPTGGTNYLLMGATQMMSVPYALHSETSEDSFWEITNNDIHYYNGRVGIGTISPEIKLDVVGPAQGIEPNFRTFGDIHIGFGTTYGGGIFFGSDGYSWNHGDYIRQGADGRMDMVAGGSSNGTKFLINDTYDGAQVLNKEDAWFRIGADNDNSGGDDGTQNAYLQFTTDGGNDGYDGLIWLENLSGDTKLHFDVENQETMVIHNGRVGVGTSSPASSSAMEINSSSRGFLPPRVADTIAVSSPVEGLMVYDLDRHCMRYYNGTKWSACMGIEELYCGNNFTDQRDGQTYSTVQIGFQCWMAENLNFGTMINGTVNQTDNGTIEKYCYYEATSNCNTYGGLYQWNEMMQYAASGDVKGICPDGWHIPSYNEINTLEDFLGGSYEAGGKMKEAGSAHWNSPNTGATNSSGFTGLPGGDLYSSGYYSSMGEWGYWWTSTPYGTDAWSMSLYRAGAYSTMGKIDQDFGLSVRCVRGNSAP
ncbi:MAG: hypothetical protein DRJ05_17935, partial [Bacteroidetes bacterium]